MCSLMTWVRISLARFDSDPGSQTSPPPPPPHNRCYSGAGIGFLSRPEFSTPPVDLRRTVAWYVFGLLRRTQEERDTFGILSKKTTTTPIFEVRITMLLFSRLTSTRTKILTNDYDVLYVLQHSTYYIVQVIPTAAFSWWESNHAPTLLLSPSTLRVCTLGRQCNNTGAACMCVNRFVCTSIRTSILYGYIVV